MLDTLIVNPNNRLQSPFAAIEPPFWAGLIAADLTAKGQTVDILDCEAENLNTVDSILKIRDLSPAHVLIVLMGNNPSVSSTPKMPVAKHIIQGLRGMDVSVTGLHPSALPEETESELGVPVRKGKIFEGTPDIPYHLMPPGGYRAHNWHCLDGSDRTPYAVTYTSLGCPFNCDFCNIHALYGTHQVWHRPVEAIEREFRMLRDEYKVRNVKIWDELFTLKESRVLEICEAIKPYGMNIWAYARIDTVTAPMLKAMKEAGINWVGIGYESYKPSGDKHFDPLQMRRATEMIQAAKINIIGNFIFGLGCDEDTFNFARSLRLDYVNLYDIKAYPGSRLYREGKDWKSYSQFSNGSGFRDMAFLRYFMYDRYLERIENKFGGQAVESILAMLVNGKPKEVQYGNNCTG